MEVVIILHMILLVDIALMNITDLTNSVKYGHPDLEVLAAILCKDLKFKN
jgi:hypothetical protein